jgi:hypothetical protein
MEMGFMKSKLEAGWGQLVVRAVPMLPVIFTKNSPRLFWK